MIRIDGHEENFILLAILITTIGGHESNLKLEIIVFSLPTLQVRSINISINNDI